MTGYYIVLLNLVQNPWVNGKRGVHAVLDPGVQHQDDKRKGTDPGSEAGLFQSLSI
jgi:hypothetical protein